MKINYRDFLEKILNSKGFVNSENLRKLLAYLVNCSAEGKPAKETQIAIDVFERDLTHNGQDSTIVRVNIHNLRKKLSHYYLTEGKNDNVRFVIPKGRYRVEFEERQHSDKEKRKSAVCLSRQAFLLLVFTLLAAAISLLFFLKSNKEIAKTEIWKDFTNSEKPTMVVLGDYFFYKGKDTAQNQDLVIRDFRINSKDDFDSFVHGSPGLSAKYEAAGFGYLGYSMPFALKELLPALPGADLEICLMSEFNSRYLQQYNIVFVGLYKTMGLFKNYFQHSGFAIDDQHNTLGIKGAKDCIDSVFVQSGQVEQVHDDYAIAAKFPGPANNHIFLFSSFHDSGLTECVKAFTNPGLLDGTCSEIEAKCGKIPKYFELLLKVAGANRTDISSKILHVNKLGANTNYWEIN